MRGLSAQPRTRREPKSRKESSAPFPFVELAPGHVEQQALVQPLAFVHHRRTPIQRFVKRGRLGEDRAIVADELTIL